jgi:hypothetical protein
MTHGEHMKDSWHTEYVPYEWDWSTEYVPYEWDWSF